MQKIGLLGGTFDPPHVGHMVAAQWARELLALDEVWLLVAPQPYQKSERKVTDFSFRMHLVTLAAQHLTGVVASDAEYDIVGPTYTVNTLALLREKNPDCTFTWLCGSDALNNIETWMRWQEVAEHTDFGVFLRDGESVAVPPNVRWRIVDVPHIGVSSTMIRQRVQEGKPIDYLVAEPVRAEIHRRGLYRCAI